MLILMSSAESVRGLAAAIRDDSQHATLAQIDGNVTLFSSPGATPEGPSPRALLDGVYYTVREARVGDAVAQNEILRALPGARAKLLYENGDQLFLAPGSAYRISWKKQLGKPWVELDLRYGRIRAILEKGGPRTRFRVKTRAAVIGVRGTDFWVGDSPADKRKIEVTVIRGKVAVTPPKPAAVPRLAGRKTPPPPPAKPVVVAAGSTARLAPPPPPAPRPEPMATAVPSPEVGRLPVPPPAPERLIEVVPTSKEVLRLIRDTTTVRAQPASVPEETRKKIENLEKRATETVLKEIKTENKELYAKITSAAAQGADPSALVVEKQEETAPSRPEDLGSEETRLREGEAGAYGKLPGGG